MMKKYKVYCHTNKINGKRYVGITHLPPNKRWQNGLGYKPNKHFTSAINKYGWEEFTHEILFEDLTLEEACEKEKELIAKWDLCNQSKGYNNTYGGEHGLMSEHTKKQMSIKRKGDKAYWYGKKLSQDAKSKMSKAKKGKIPKSNPPKRVYCYETDATYESMSEASRQLGICVAYVHKICHGQIKKDTKYHLVFV